MAPSHLLEHCIATLKQPSTNREPQDVHLLAVLLTDRLRAWPSKLSYLQLSTACRALNYANIPPRVRLDDKDEGGQLVFRVLLAGSILVQRRFGTKTWLPVGFLHAGDSLGLPAMLESTPDDIRYTTLSEPAEFAVLRRFEFERCLKSTFEKEIHANIAVLRSQPSFASLPEHTLKQLVSSSRLVSLPAGELLTREGDATDEVFVLKSGVVRLVKSLQTAETFRWPTTKRPADFAETKQDSGDSDVDHHDPCSPDKIIFRQAPGISAEKYSVLAAAVQADAPPPGASFPPRVNRRVSRESRESKDSHISGGSGSARSQLEGDYLPAEGSEYSDDDEADNDAKLYREVTNIQHNRIVVVGDVREGHTFAYDEAMSVIRRIAAARAKRTSNVAFKELPPIRRNVTAFCLTSVSAIAMSPINLILFVGHDHLASFIRSFGPPRTPRVLDKQLRQQRAWRQYKHELLHSAVDKEPTRLQMFVGPRRLPPPVGGRTLDARFERKGGQALSAPPLHVGGGGSSGSGRRDGTKRSLLDGLGDVVNGAASAELAEASSDLGTAITESSRRQNSLQPSIIYLDTLDAASHELLDKRFWQ
jgi:CRP-like cAMP-binding protein